MSKIQEFKQLLKLLITLHNVCAVHQGMFSRLGGYHWIHWGLFSTLGGGGGHITNTPRLFSTVGIPWVHWRNTMMTVGGYHEYTGGCSAHWGFHTNFSCFPNDRPSHLSWYPTCVLMISPTVLMISSSVLNILHCTARILVYCTNIMQGGDLNFKFGVLKLTISKLRYERYLLKSRSSSLPHKIMKICHTVNASKLIEKCFLDLRNIFLNQKNIRKFFSKQ